MSALALLFALPAFALALGLSGLDLVGLQRRGHFARDMHKCCNQRRHRITLRDHQADAVVTTGSTIGMLRTASASPSVSASFAGIMLAQRPVFTWV